MALKGIDYYLFSVMESYSIFTIRYSFAVWTYLFLLLSTIDHYTNRISPQALPVSLG